MRVSTSSGSISATGRSRTISNDSLASATSRSERGRPVAVLADLPGPKIRAGAFPAGGVRLVAGESVTLRPGTGTSDVDHITVPYPTLVEDLTVGSRVQLGDGAIAIARHRDRCRLGRRLNWRPAERPTVDPGSTCRRRRLRLPSPTPEDLVLAEAVARGRGRVHRGVVRPGRRRCRPGSMRWSAIAHSWLRRSRRLRRSTTCTRSSPRVTW